LTNVVPSTFRSPTDIFSSEALHYKPESGGFESRWCHWNFSLTYSFRPHCDPWVDSASNSNEYQEYFLGSKGGRCLGLTSLPLSYADCLKIWEPQPPWNPLGLSRPVIGLLYIYSVFLFRLLSLINRKVEYDFYFHELPRIKASSPSDAICSAMNSNLRVFTLYLILTAVVKVQFEFPTWEVLPWQFL